MSEGGELKAFVIIILVASAFLLGMGVFIDDITTNYNITEDQALPSGTTYYMNMSQDIDSMQGDLDTSIEGTQGEDNLLVASWKTIKKVFESAKTMKNLINTMSKSLMLPEELQGIVGIMAAIVTAVVIFAIIGVVTRTRAP